ncbi:MAG TPA: tyrosine-type recombinase/integrase [Verrucomicrobiota bacterium]|nr:tyrosine-type recombinase/integrase [Verrucomicrobiota bacterium]
MADGARDNLDWAPQAVFQRQLDPVEFEALRRLPHFLEWLANLPNANTRRAYQADLIAFMRFAGLKHPDDFSSVARAHVLAWRKDLERRALQPATIRPKLSALSELFEFLCEENCIARNPVHGVRRPREGANEGKTPALSDAQAKRLLAAPATDSLKDRRDRAILAVLLYHALRRGELCRLRVSDFEMRRGIPTLVVHGKGSRLRYLPVHPAAAALIEDYLECAGHREDVEGPLFRPVRNSRGSLVRPLSGQAVYQNIVKHYADQAAISVRAIRPHCLRATAATNALEHGADIARVRDWLGHSAITTTQLYDKRRHRPQDSPTFKVEY